MARKMTKKEQIIEMYLESKVYLDKARKAGNERLIQCRAYECCTLADVLMYVFDVDDVYLAERAKQYIREQSI